MSVDSQPSSAVAKLTVPGMGSDHCAGIVKTSLQRLDSVGDITTNIASHRVEVTYDPSTVDLDDLRKAVENAGYDVAAANTSGAGKNAQLIVPGMGSDQSAVGIQGLSHRLGEADSPTDSRRPESGAFASNDSLLLPREAEERNRKLGD